jgi:uncharacterized membrane protein YhhN
LRKKILYFVLGFLCFLISQLKKLAVEWCEENGISYVETQGGN